MNFFAFIPVTVILVTIIVDGKWFLNIPTNECIIFGTFWICFALLGARSWK
jgi:hypothetical protein